MDGIIRALKSPRITTNLVAGVVILGLIVLASLLGPYFVDLEKALVGSVPPSLAPTPEYLLGTDSQGRDMLAVMVVAIPQTLKMGIIAGLVGITIGLVLGLLSGFFGGPIDTVVRIFADSLMTVPGIAILIIIASNVESMSVELMALTVAALAWMFPTRTIRSQVLSIRERAYTAVARANGMSEMGVLFREIMPNLLPYVAASLVVSINGAILATVGLESLGLGAENVHTLGTTIYWARRYSAILRGQWWWWGPPIAIISLIFIGLFLLSAGLDRFANPTLSTKPRLSRRRKRELRTEAKDRREATRVRTAQIAQEGMGMGAGMVTRMNTNGADRDLLMVEDLCVVYETPAGAGLAVDHVSFTLKPGERMGLIGESGCGKTTMATGLMSLIRPPGRVAGGHVFLEGRDLLSLSEAEVRQMRLRDVALMPQAAMNSLNPVLRIRDQIVDALVAHDKSLTEQQQEAIVTKALTQVGLPATAADRFPHQLSGGMKQRVAMAIATVLSPKLIIADEPTSALDVVVQRQVMNTLGHVQKELGAAIILIGHDMGLVAQFSDSIGVLYAGQMVERGSVDDVLESPRHPYTRLLIDSLPGLEMRKDLIGIPGLPPALFERPAGCRFHPRCPYAFDRCRHEVPVAQQIDGREVACHLYPEHDDLPPLPTEAVTVGIGSTGDDSSTGDGSGVASAPTAANGGTDGEPTKSASNEVEA